MKKSSRWHFSRLIHNIPWKTLILSLLAASLLSLGIILIWVSTFRIPDLDSLRAKALSQSTKIYDRTGTVLLYDLNPNLKRTVVSFDQISQNAKNAAVAIEDDEFYTHSGVRPLSFLRAILADIMAGSFEQGGSTITQQVIKNSLLTNEKTIPRKIKEWVLAIRLEQIADKDTILNLYLNSIPYGGNLYGIEEASQAFFAKPAVNLTIAEAAYLAAIPQAPTYYSPFGKNKAALDARKNMVLQRMFTLGFINQADFDAAKAEKVAFQSGINQKIKAPHFVMYIKSLLEKKYGEELVQNGGLKVITTINYDMQSKVEAIAKEYGVKNEKTYKASNAATVVIDPKTGQILAMVGSRDYFDKTIEGNFNVAIAPNRQPGSTFKPFIYAQAFNDGYTPDTILFDVKTEFSTGCTPSSTPITTDARCYSPVNFDNKYRGPMTIRQALAGSINVPAVKMLYLVGLKDAIKLSQDMGITSLSDPNRYGLTLVLGGGEVSPLEMTSGYSVFANNGVRNPAVGILSVKNSAGNTLEEFALNPTTVLSEQSALEISDILSDNQARALEYGTNSPLNIPGYDVAAKTGTTNNYVDAWIMGYTPTLVVGAWAGNNDNTPMEKKISGYIVAPMWRAMMDKLLPMVPNESFKKPEPIPQDIKPVLRGIWQGGSTMVIDNRTGQPATSDTPAVNRVEQVVPAIHDILYWVDKNNPRGPAPQFPANDPQFTAWEYGVQQWAKTKGYINDFGQTIIGTGGATTTATSTVPVTNITLTPISFISPVQGSTFNKNDQVTTGISTPTKLSRVDYFVNSQYIGTTAATATTTQSAFLYTFTPSTVTGISATSTNMLRAVGYDLDGKTTQATTFFYYNQ